MSSSMGFHTALLTALALLVAAPSSARRRVPKKFYLGSPRIRLLPVFRPTTGHVEHWLQYSAAETERDFDFAGAFS